MSGIGFLVKIADESGQDRILSLGEDWLYFPNKSAANLIAQFLESVTCEEFSVIDSTEVIDVWDYLLTSHKEKKEDSENVDLGVKSDEQE